MAKDRLKDLSELLSAYLDGELEESVRAEVVAYLDRDAGAVRVLNELRETRSMLQDLPHQSAPAGFSESVVSAVERQALLGGESDTAARMSTRRRWGPIRAAASIALLVGAAGSWIYYQSDRRQSTDLALREAVAPDAITGRATDRSIGLDALAVLDGTAEEPSRSDQPLTHMKKSARGKAAAPARLPADLRGMDQKAEMELAEQQQQSIVQRDLTMQAGDLDEEVVMLGANPENSTWFDGAAGTEQVNFDLAGQSREARLGGAAQPDFSRRLQANEPAVSLAFYHFSNEPNVLTLSFSSDAQRDEFSQDVDVYLADNGFLSAADPRERVLVVEPLIQNVVLHGLQGLNYAEPHSEQILLSASPEVLEGLIDRYAETTGGLEDTAKIELQMGEMKVEGLESTRRTVQALAVREEQRRVLGYESQTADRLDDAAADSDERLTAAQWRKHFARLGLPAKTKQGQAAVAKQSGADKDGGLARSEDESSKAAAGEQNEQAELKVSGDPSPALKSAGKKTSEPKEEIPHEEQAAGAGEKNQGEAGMMKKKRRARSAKGARSGEIELFGGMDEGPPASEPANGDSPGRGGRGGGIFEQLKDPGPSGPLGRASNLTFVLKLRTVPTLEMGPPAPSPETDDPEE